MLGGNNGLGNVRTEQIKRVAKELIRRFPNRFSNNFDENKRVVDTLVQGATTKVRNQIAGYITHAFAGTQTASPSSETSEDTEEE
ncbi:MAG: 30S ribosomal protein S17e [Candidatus Bathyarchaeia archaeon]